MSTSRNVGSLIGGALLIVFGLLALISQLFRGFNLWSSLWPFFIIAFGVMFFVIMLSAGRSLSGLAIPGSIFTVIGLMLFLQNMSGYWESWSYGWTIILMAVGAGIYIMGLWGRDAGQKLAGLGVLRTGLVLFIIFGAFFELIFSIGRAVSLGALFFPVALILLGLYLVLTRSGLLKDPLANNASSQSKEES